MSFLELAQKRYSVRKYESKPVEEDKLVKILEAAKVAPTAVNYQPQRLIVVRQPDRLAKLQKAANIYGAPLAIIVCADYNAAWKRPHDNKNFADVDASIVTDHMMLQATELGLGTVWVGHFKPDVIKTEFNLPDQVEPVNILVIGYAAVDSVPTDRHTDRKPLTETVFYETF
ncbi:FMN reductase (NAD(P)H) [Sporotomaculum syntrophicum]|uniref:FMN reductase (NAD(P)H) n=1 Tax=Sporotomaculum syntrophicum TaxID=182264 RepID=A0A9D2WPK2_9FIRM|nr:nitroreductase family protein [Sporotomaculum syntrophicum]KAF1085089.1 FMN reductase (NAD(P)H) [Sporotomaculum syntrophicum]